MAKSKFIVVKEKATHREVERINVDHLYGDFQIGYEAGKLEKNYPVEEFIIYLQKVKS